MIALRVRSTYSAGRGLSKPDDLAKRLSEAGYSGAVLADHATLGGVPSVCGALGKKELRAIAGAEFVLPEGFVTAVSLDQAGWRSLVLHTTLANTAERFDRGPRLHEPDLDQLGRTCLLLDGYCFSRLVQVIARPELYQATSPEDARACLAEGWLERGLAFVREQKKRFPQYFLGIERVDPTYAPALVLADCVREIADALDSVCLPLMDAHYPQQEDCADQRVLACVALKCTTLDAQRAVQLEHPSLQRYFRTSRLHLLPKEEFVAHYTQGELALLEDLFGKAEPPILKGKPMFPTFIPPNGQTCDEMMRGECRLGWKRVIEPLLKKAPAEERPRLKQVYGDRAKSELETLTEAGLSPYFLCVQDAIRYAKDVLKKKVGRGRGCLTPDSLIMMTSGHCRRIADIVVGDEVISRDGLPHRVLRTMRYPCSEPVVQILGYYAGGEPIELTGDHKVLVEKCRRPKGWENWSEITRRSRRRQLTPTGDLEWVRADSVCVDDWVFVPTIQVREERHQFDLATYANGDRLTHDEEHVYHTVKCGRPHRIVAVHKNARRIPLDSEFAYLLGLFTGNGFLLRKKEDVVGIAFNNQSKALQWMFAWVKKHGYHYTVQKNGPNCTSIYVISPFLRSLFRDLFPDYQFEAQTKQIPQCVFSSDRVVRLEYLRGVTDTDGSRDKTRSGISSSSENLAYQLRHLLLTLGVPSSLSRSERFDHREEFYGLHVSYVVRYPRCLIDPVKSKSTLYRQIEGGVLMRVRAVSSRDYRGDVHDIEVEGQHNYLSTNYIVHNSVGGSLVAWLMGITGVDPIEHDLLFERFWNKARKDSVPDIDTDFEKSAREPVVEYLHQKYGRENVCRIGTHSSLNGKSALDAILRVHGQCSFMERKRITKAVPDKSRITDDLQEMLEEEGSASIIRWSLENRPEAFLEWVHYDESGELAGDLWPEFAQAMRLEGSVSHMGVHACGVIVSPVPLADLIPLVRSEKGERVTGFTMGEADKLGLTKLDILGLVTLDRVALVERLLRTGSFD